MIAVRSGMKVTFFFFFLVLQFHHALAIIFVS